MRFLLILSASFLFISGEFLPRGLEPSGYPDLPDKTIKIGLLIPSNKCTAARNGAELAIMNANRNGGINGMQFRLVVRSMEGPWGTGSKEAVSLIFDEKVAAILGSHDGRNAHLVEQVTTKSQTVFLSAWAGDPTLSQAFVPWYFTCAPTDLQQADALIEEICNKRKLTKIVAISDNGYDSKLALESFSKRLNETEDLSPVEIYYDDQNPGYDHLISQISKASPQGIILFGKPYTSLKLIRLLQKGHPDVPLFGGLSLQNEDDMQAQELSDYGNITLISSGNLLTLKNIAFRKEFYSAYGKNPGAVAEYAYDGMNLLIDAVKEAGTERENIQKALEGMHFEGVTGTLRFDDKGKRLGKPEVTKLINGIAVKTEP
jgi:branched-chain amino acid transport system substrate-binding protein